MRAVPKMLKAGGQVLVKAQKEEIQRMGLVDTGDMLNSVKATAPKEKDGVMCVEVYPAGKDRKGVDNAKKGFVLNYGTSKIRARPWHDVADKRAAGDVVDAMRQVWEDEPDG